MVSRLLFLTVLLLQLNLSYCLDFLQPSSNYSVEPTLETVEEFNKTINEKVKFIYLKLNFTNIEFKSTEFAYLNETINVIDPLTWVLAIGGNGELLLKFPFEFRYMSIGTLSASGVKTLTLNIKASEKFTTVSDEEKLSAIENMIDELTQNAVNYFNEIEDETILRVKAFRICLEKQYNDTTFVYRDKRTIKTLFLRLTYSPYGVLQDTVKYTCWPVARGSQYEPKTISRVRAYWYINGILNFGVILIVLFIPYPFLSYFDWHNPPVKDKEGHIWINIDTKPYPLGFFHFVFFSTFGSCLSRLCPLSSFLRYFFVAVILCFLCCVQFIPYAYVDHDKYQLRKLAAQRLGVWQFDGWNLFMPLYCMALIIFLITLFNILKCYISGRRRIDLNRVGKAYLTKLLFGEIGKWDDKEITETLWPDLKEGVFVQSPNFNGIRKIWDLLESLMKKQNRCEKIKNMLLVIPYLVGQSIPLIYYSNIVLVVIVSLVHINFGNMGNNRLAFVGWFILLPLCFLAWFVFITVPLFIQMYIAFFYLIDVVGYTLVGVVVNAKDVISYLLFGLSIVTFLVTTVHGYSKAYLRLFRKIYKMAKKIEAEKREGEKTESPAKRGARKRGGEGGESPAERGARDSGGENIESPAERGARDSGGENIESPADSGARDREGENIESPAERGARERGRENIESPAERGARDSGGENIESPADSGARDSGGENIESSAERGARERGGENIESPAKSGARDSGGENIESPAERGARERGSENIESPAESGARERGGENIKSPAKRRTRDSEDDRIDQINVTFFSEIAYEVRPWKLNLFKVYLNLIFGGVIFFFGYWLLQYVDGLDDLTGLSELFGAVIIGSLLPVVHVITIPDEGNKFNKDALKWNLEKLIKKKIDDPETRMIRKKPVEVDKATCSNKFPLNNISDKAPLIDA